MLLLLLAVGNEKGLRVVIAVGGRVADSRQLAVLATGGALPVAAVGVLERVHLGVGVVSDPRHALGEPFLVGVVVREARHFEAIWESTWYDGVEMIWMIAERPRRSKCWRKQGGFARVLGNRGLAAGRGPLA